MKELQGGRTVISCQTDTHERIDLLRFPDGTIAVRRNDQTVGIWAPCEQEAGVTAYCDLAGIGRRARTGAPADLIVVIRTHHPFPTPSNN